MGQKGVETRFVNGTEAWSSIQEAVKRGPSFIAVAWWGTGMSETLPLTRGSVLVVRADPATIKNGLTNPFELAELVDRGVQVHSLRNLHAKIYVAGGKAIIGSMNASSQSFNGKLAEAALETRAVRSVAAAKRAVLGWAIEPALDPTDLEKLKGIYNPPKFGGAKPKNLRKPGHEELELPKLKILRTRVDPKGWKEHTQQRFDQDSPVLEQQAADDDELLEALEWTGRRLPKVRADTLYLQISRDGRSRRLFPPARIRKITGTKRGKPQKIVYLSHSKGSKVIPLSKVLRAFGSGSLLAGKLRTKRGLITDPQDIRRILALWAPSK